MAGRFSPILTYSFASVIFAVQSLHADPLNSVAKQLAKAMANYKKDGHIAILVFPYEDGGLSSGSSLVSERLTTLMAGRKHISVIERARLADLLGETRLEGTGVTDSSGAIKSGGIMGVDAVVTGTLTDSMEGETEVNARLIRVETGEIIAAASANINKTWQDRPHPPAPPPGSVDDDDHYVMHESPLIFTPQGHRGSYAPPRNSEPSVAFNNSYAGAGSESYYEAPRPTAGVPAAMINSRVVVRGPANPPVRLRPMSAERVRLLYAMGATLDVQGNRREAQRYYRQVREQMTRY
jgi:hypothetical protein